MHMCRDILLCPTCCFSQGCVHRGWFPGHVHSDRQCVGASECGMLTHTVVARPRGPSGNTGAQ